MTADLVGHQASEALLLDLWNAGRMPHAILLSGRPGIGKATLAYRLARFVLAGGGADAAEGGLFGDAPRSLFVAPDSPTFRRVASGGHVDLLVLDRPWDEKRSRRRGVIPIAAAQEAVGFLHLTAGEGGWRVVIVDAVDDLNTSSANALLKILEEPPPRVVIILVAHAPGRVLPTIRSRCRHVAMAPLSAGQMLEVLTNRNPSASDDARRLAAALAEGSPGQALALLEQGAAVIYSGWVDIAAALPDVPLARVLAFADMVGAASDETPFTVFEGLFTGWLSRLLRGSISEDDHAPTEAEQQANARLRRVGALDPWFEVWDKARAWFAETNGLNLDRKQAVSAIVEACCLAARRSAPKPAVSAPPADGSRSGYRNRDRDDGDPHGR